MTAGRLEWRRALAVVLTVACAPVAARAAPAPAPVVPAEVRPGDLFLLRFPPGGQAPATVEFLGKSYHGLRDAQGGTLFLLGSDLEAACGPQELRWTLPGAPPRAELATVAVVPRRFAEERLTLPPAMVTPPRELEERIAREQRLAAEVYRTSAPGPQWEGGFARALDAAPAGNFGKRRILNGLPRSPHGGQDYTAEAGTLVRAVGRGRVRLAADFYYSGLTLLVDHGGGLVSQYLHLRRFHVAEGDLVERGAPLGEVGATGRATGPHLHLGLRLFEQRVDPESLWGLLPGTREVAGP